MRKIRVVWPIHVYRLYPHRPNRSDGQVRILFHCSAVLDPENSRRRVYAVTKTNFSITFGFAAIAITELAVGLLVVLD